MNKIKRIIAQYWISILIGLGVLVGIGILIKVNPFGLWVSEKISLEDTPTILKELNKIGEFVTAEYSGETIESLKEGAEANVILIEGEMDSLKQIFSRINDFYPPIRKRASRLKKRKKLFKKLSFYDRYEDQFRMLEKASNKNLGELLEYAHNAEVNWETFMDEHELFLRELVKKKLDSRSRRKIKVAYLGRGRVKAGFDLTGLENPALGIEMEPNEQKDTLIIRNLDPEILDADINPWFIHDAAGGLKIPGYELLKLNSPKNVDFKDITAVKLACKRSLVRQALYDREILESALRSGEETFRDLFNLFRDESETALRAVIIEPTLYSEFKVSLLHDGPLDLKDVQKIRKRLSMDKVELTSAQARALLTSLRKHEKDMDRASLEAWDKLVAESGL